MSRRLAALGGNARTLRGYGRFAASAWRASPAMAVVTALTTLVAAVTPVVTVAAVGAVVGHVPTVIRSGLGSPAGAAAVTWAVVVAALFAVGRGGAAARSAAATALGGRVDFALQRQLMAAVMAPVGISHLEDAATPDLIAAGRDTFRAWLRPGRLVSTLSALFSARFSVIGGCVILARYRWPVALLVLAVAWWAEYEAKRASSRHAEHHYGESALARRTDYFYELGVTPGAAKEIRVFGLAGFLLDRFSETWRRATAPVFTTGDRRAGASVIGLAAVMLGVLAWVCRDAVAGAVGIGAATAYAQALMVILGGVSAAADARLRSEMALITVRRYDAAMDAVQPAHIPTVPAAPPASDAPGRHIRFDNIRFRYPHGDHDVLAGLDLIVPAGQSLAVVGANGAGKTSLIKLLCGLYEPTGGRILIDGEDLAALNPAGWRARIAVIFQDYVQYEMTARSNVGFGNAQAQDDLVGIESAAAAAGAIESIADLPAGWETVLSTNYAGGVDLSGGQWQKIALARALFAVHHGATVLILDEPTANLDARAEAQLYERFLALTAGVTTIVISHRFSTGRQADSIVVLRDGVVAEQGSHAGLLALDGEYAHMYRLQAARFDDPPVDPALMA